MKKPAQATERAGRARSIWPQGLQWVPPTPGHIMPRCHGKTKTWPPAGLHAPSIPQSGWQGWSALWFIHIPYVKSILQTQVGIFKKWKASFSGVEGYVGNASEELACKLKDIISHYWGVWKGDKEGRKRRIQNLHQTARLYAFEGCVPRLSRASGKEGVNISLFVFLYLNGYMYIS